MIRHVVILGGGTAGWITAATLAAAHTKGQSSPLKITLIESPDVSTIGVGEGTWPSMRSTLDFIGIDEDQFIQRCHVSLKQGSAFQGWCNGAADDIYFHPFITPPGYEQTNLAAHWQQHHSQHAFADCVSLQSHLCRAARAPKQLSTPAYAGVANYGYHLDAGQFAAMLKEHSIENLGVNYISDTVVEINNHANGDIDGLVTKAHGAIHAELFIDCSGMRSLLLGQHYGVKFIQQKSVLFNDAALALQVPYEDPNQNIASATIATAKPVGWTWDIGLAHRRGVGYTFSQDHISDEQATEVLLAHIKPSVSEQTFKQLSPRKIAFEPGYRETFWHRNCVAVGMSAGFIEPLEASALAMVELSCSMLRDEMPTNRDHMELLAQRFNRKFEYRWQRVIEFLKLHYLLSQRDDSDYWRDHRQQESIPNRLSELLKLWQFQSPNRNDLGDKDEVFPSASYQYILYGMGFKTQARETGSDLNMMSLSQQLMEDNWLKKEQYIDALPTNRQLIDHIHLRTKSTIKKGAVL